jgi:hypothetical protein
VSPGETRRGVAGSAEAPIGGILCRMGRNLRASFDWAEKLLGMASRRRLALEQDIEPKSAIAPMAIFSDHAVLSSDSKTGLMVEWQTMNTTNLLPSRHLPQIPRCARLRPEPT